MTYKILFLDIDGTILKPDHTYSEITKQAIASVKKQGVEVFLATGRPLHEISVLAGDLDIDSFIAYNGAFAIYQGETIVNEPMPQDNIEKFIEIAARNDNELIMYTRDKNYFTNLDRPFISQFIDVFNLKQNAAYTPDITDKVLGATILNVSLEQVPLYEIESNLRLSPVHVNGAEHSYDILRKNVNKGYSVEQLLVFLGLSREQAIAFGDGMNDKEMLGAVGEGFAMGNSHEDLFRYAKHKTATVTEDGIAYGLKQLGLL
ncbi:HAD family hydrolase [Lentibacillus sp. CBA3610]|uniref:HAD family hydrolase n=1 Tax=Lentibacillus sp. CBA3610 TaxID=2518176 RepID=UPI001595BFCB|nr:HAD family hydrolase [Lentibacillus sp. CBA3610]QKY70010.1 HAD family phosphatase [Lentibacillus sp. CBA3610]